MSFVQMLKTLLGCHFVRSSQMVGLGLGAGVTTETTGDDVGFCEGFGVVGFSVTTLDGEKDGINVGVQISSYIHVVVLNTALQHSSNVLWK